MPQSITVLTVADREADIYDFLAIERYHYVLKSGCGLEQLQLETADRIERAISTYTIVAWRLLWMIYESRHHPEMGGNTILETHEWQALYCTIHSTPIPTESPPTLSNCNC